MLTLQDRGACVLGAGSGIGRAIAAGLAEQGAVVDCLDADGEGAARTAENIGADRARSSTVDIRDGAAVDAALRRRATDSGALDIVVCTPGINVRKPLLDYTDEEFRGVLDVNLVGSFNVLRSAARIMAGQPEGGSIVIISSISARVVEPGQVAYAATKAGIAQMVRVAAAELGKYRVRVNAIAPGPVETALTAPIVAVPQWRDAYGERTALGRWGLPEEIAAPAVFLSSPAASYVTGSVMFVDGGAVDMSVDFQDAEPAAARG